MSGRQTGPLPDAPDAHHPYCRVCDACGRTFYSGRSCTICCAAPACKRALYSRWKSERRGGKRPDRRCAFPGCTTVVVGIRSRAFCDHHSHERDKQRRREYDATRVAEGRRRKLNAWEADPEPEIVKGGGCAPTGWAPSWCGPGWRR